MRYNHQSAGITVNLVQTKSATSIATELENPPLGQRTTTAKREADHKAR